jgi:LCP family protein required for cell wall assembly
MKRKDPLWAKLVITFGALVIVGSGAIAVGPRLAAWWALRDIEQIDAIPTELLGETLEGEINVLLVGLDANLQGLDETPRTDSIMLVHIPASHQQVYMVSFPRDLHVTVPAIPETGVGDYTTKINAAFGTGARSTDHAPGAWGEPDLSKAGLERGVAQTMRTISDLVPGGLEFHGAAIIDFAGFEKVVEAVGGVNMCIDEEVYSIHYWPDGRKSGNPLWRGLNNDEPADGDYGDGYHYEVGCRDLEPWQALDYSRQRYGLHDSDYGRQRHQQQLLKAIVKKIVSPDTATNLATLANLQDAAGDLLTLSLGGHEILDWAWTVKDLRADSITMVKFNGGTFCDMPDSTDECIYPDSIELLSAIQNDTIFDFLAAHPDWVSTE